jgi:hypothetical protein
LIKLHQPCGHSPDWAILCILWIPTLFPACPTFVIKNGAEIEAAILSVELALIIPGENVVRHESNDTDVFLENFGLGGGREKEEENEGFHWAVLW